MYGKARWASSGGYRKGPTFKTRHGFSWNYFEQSDLLEGYQVRGWGIPRLAEIHQRGVSGISEQLNKLLEHGLPNHPEKTMSTGKTDDFRITLLEAFVAEKPIYYAALPPGHGIEMQYSKHSGISLGDPAYSWEISAFPSRRADDLLRAYKCGRQIVYRRDPGHVWSEWHITSQIAFADPDYAWSIAKEYVTKYASVQLNKNTGQLAMYEDSRATPGFAKYDFEDGVLVGVSLVV